MQRSDGPAMAWAAAAMAAYSAGPQRHDQGEPGAPSPLAGSGGSVSYSGWRCPTSISCGGRYGSSARERNRVSWPRRSPSLRVGRSLSARPSSTRWPRTSKRGVGSRARCSWTRWVSRWPIGSGSRSGTPRRRWPRSRLRLTRCATLTPVRWSLGEGRSSRCRWFWDTPRPWSHCGRMRTFGPATTTAPGPSSTPFSVPPRTLGGPRGRPVGGTCRSEA